MKYIKEDILKSKDIDMILYQANCFNIMDNGLSKDIKKYYNNVYTDTQITKIGDTSKLGLFDVYMENNINTNKEMLICSLYSQYKPGPCSGNNTLDSIYNRYTYLESALTKLINMVYIYKLDNPNKEPIKVGVPWIIGCGSSGGDQNIIFDLFKRLFHPHKEHAIIYFFDKKGNI